MFLTFFNQQAVMWCDLIHQMTGICRSGTTTVCQ
jgi:hypothetical protein